VEFETENLGIVTRPFALVSLIYSSTKKSVPLLVDSGADVTVISLEIGLELGLGLEEGERLLSLGGVVGAIPVVYRNLQLQIGDAEPFTAKVAWSQIEVTNVLGRIAVFDNFDIELKQAERVSIFRER
jgi:hypothetical protein